MNVLTESPSRPSYPALPVDPSSPCNTHTHNHAPCDTDIYIYWLNGLNFMQ